MKARTAFTYLASSIIVLAAAAPGFAATPTGEPWNPTSGVGRMTQTPTGDNNPSGLGRALVAAGSTDEPSQPNSGVGRMTPSPTGDNNPSGLGRSPAVPAGSRTTFEPGSGVRTCPAVAQA